MLRIIAVQLLLFLTPFILFGLYVYFTERRFDMGEFTEKGRLFWLTVSGFIVAIIGFIVLGVFSGAPPEGEYRPAELIDGQIRPGEIVVPDKEQE